MPKNMIILPKSTHPWKLTYQARFGKKETNGSPQQTRKPLQVLLTGIIENWSHVQVPLYYRGHFDSYTLLELPDEKVAGWLIKTLKQYTHYSNSEAEEIEEVPFDQTNE